MSRTKKQSWTRDNLYFKCEKKSIPGMLHSPWLSFWNKPVKREMGQYGAEIWHLVTIFYRNKVPPPGWGTRQQTYKRIETKLLSGEKRQMNKRIKTKFLPRGEAPTVQRNWNKVARWEEAPDVQRNWNKVTPRGNIPICTKELKQSYPLGRSARRKHANVHLSCG